MLRTSRFQDCAWMPTARWFCPFSPLLVTACFCGRPRLESSILPVSSLITVCMTARHYAFLLLGNHLMPKNAKMNDSETRCEGWPLFSIVSWLMPSHTHQLQHLVPSQGQPPRCNGFLLSIILGTIILLVHVDGMVWPSYFFSMLSKHTECLI